MSSGTWIMNDDFRIRTYTGQAISQVATPFRWLQRTVFSEWPYLFGGNSAGGQAYTNRYTLVPRAALFLATAGGEPVGAATCMPLEEESANIQAPFLERGWNPRRFFYFGEGIVLKEWRGRGLGVRFFALRESHARATSTADYTVFCSVRRPADHPLRPESPASNDRFWRHRGYVPLPGVSCVMHWTDHGEIDRSPHTLDFWIKSLSGAPLPCD
jgi:GNAT superfamily N-acetyltransferase